MKSESRRSDLKRKAERRRPPLRQGGELLAAGLEHHRAGRLAEAERCYRAAVKKSPRFPEAAHLLGRVLYDLQKPEEALAWLKKAVALGPSRANAVNDLGNLLQELGRPEEAEASYRRVLELEADSADAYSNLGTALKERGLVDEALDAYRRAIESDSNHYGAYCNLGNLLKRNERFEEAVSAYRQALRIDPRRSDAHRNLCGALKSLGDWERAAGACREWLAREPDNPVARHMMAAFSGEDTPARADDEYVVKVFDDFAETFDQQLASLNNSGPQRIAEALAEEGLTPTGALDVLDAGCGTGLCGPVLRPYAGRLTGVDLSGQMLRKAGQRNVYDELAAAELTAFIAAHPETYDLIVSADTLVYFGELTPVLRAVSSSLRPGGRFVCTLERMETPPDDQPGYRLNRHGRYTHSPDYVDGCLSKSGLRPLRSKSVDLREQAGQPVGGLLVTAARP
jgi:predicted TPR repeat methyltransferase